MSTQTLPLAVNKVLFDKVGKGEEFTAYDVTQAVRQDVGPSVNVSHEDVKSLVHAAFLQNLLGSYQRDHDASYGAYRYSPVSVAAIPNSPAIPVSSSVAPTIPVVAKVAAAPRNVLRVLKSAVSDANLSAGDKVKAVYSPIASRIWIVPATNFSLTTNDPGAKTADYTVDVKENIRINLDGLGISKKASSINAINNSIEIVLV